MGHQSFPILCITLAHYRLTALEMSFIVLFPHKINMKVYELLLCVETAVQNTGRASNNLLSPSLA